MTERLAALKWGEDEDYFLTADYLRVYVRRRGHDFTFNRRSITAINISRMPYGWATLWSGFATIGAAVAGLLFLLHEVGWLQVLFGVVAFVLAVVSAAFFFGPFRERIGMIITVPNSVKNRYTQYCDLGWYGRKRYKALSEFAAQVNRQLKALREDVAREKQAGAEFRSYDWLRDTLRGGLTQLLAMLPSGPEEKVPMRLWNGIEYELAYDDGESLSVLQVCAVVVNQLRKKYSPDEIRAMMAGGCITAVMVGDIEYMKHLMGWGGLMGLGALEDKSWARH